MQQSMVSAQLVVQSLQYLALGDFLHLRDDLCGEGLTLHTGHGQKVAQSGLKPVDP